MDEPIEQISPADVARVNRDRLPGRYERWSQADGTVRPLPVVVLGIGPERPVQMPPPPDQRRVEALGPDRFDHPFRVGVGVRLQLLRVGAIRSDSM